MPRFKFRLEAALRLTERELETERRRLAAELDLLYRQQALCQEQETKWHTALAGQKEAGLRNPGRLGSWQAYTVSLLKRLRVMLQEKAQQEKAVEEQRSRVRKALQEQKKLQKLKEKQAAAFWLQEQRCEQKLIDEAGQILFFRQQDHVVMEAEEGTNL